MLPFPEAMSLKKLRSSPLIEIPNLGQYSWSERHRLSDIEGLTRMATCSICGYIPIKNKGRLANGERKWVCLNAITASKKKRKIGKYTKSSVCSRCGFVAEHLCQIDVHHRDGDPTNNDLTNLEDLCANCHRYITQMGRCAHDYVHGSS